MKPSVLVLLDMRGYREPPGDADGYRALWTRLEPELIGRDLRRAGTITVDRPGHGTIGAIVINAADCPERVDASTPFAICGILEPPRLVSRCGTCGRYGPFVCVRCGPDDDSRRVCDDHVVILDLTLDRATCPAHVPVCACGRTATFWCAGARCRRRTAWCDGHRRPHPGDPLTSYCDTCYDERFPACVVPRCTGNGRMSCEFTVGTGRCAARACAGHAYDWKVFGPKGRGLVLCPDHRAVLPGLAREDLVFQIFAGTAARRRAGRQQPKPPRLTGLRHVFINIQNQLIGISALYEVVEATARRYGSGNQPLADLVGENRAVWQADVRTERERRVQGEQHVAKIQRWLTELNRPDVAAALTFSEFKPHLNEVWVHVPEQLRGRFFGAKGVTIKELERRLGLRIRTEWR